MRNKLHWISVLFVLFWLLDAGVVWSQTITGWVTDEQGSPVSHASVVIQGSKTGTTTDKNGAFEITSKLLADSAEIIVRFIGYKPETRQVIAGSTLPVRIVLVKDALQVSEVEVAARQREYYESVMTPVRVTTLDSSGIRSIPSISAAGLFNTVSGVNVSNEFGIFSSSTVVSLRGIGGNSQNGTLVLVDGTPLNKSDAGSVNWNIIDKDRIEKVEIVKGPGSALYGTNAMGGIINIITRQPAEPLTVAVSASYGTFNTYDGRLNISGRTSDGLLYWRGFGSMRKSDGYINTPDEVIKENDTVVVPVYLDETFTGAAVGYNFNEKNNAEISFSYFNDIRGRGIKIYEYEGSNVERNTYHAYAKYRGQIKKTILYANLFSLYEDYFRLNEYYSDGYYNLYEIQSYRNDYGAKLWAEYPLSKHSILTGGADLKTGSVNGADIYYTASDVIRNRGQMDIYAAFLQHKIQFGESRWSVVTGLRYDAASFHDAAFTIETPSYAVEYLVNYQFTNLPPTRWQSVNPKLAVEYNTGKVFRYYISAGKGFRAPILDELCRSEDRNMGFRKANPEIKPEYIYNFEYGMDALLLKKIKASLSVFYAMGFDFMYLVRTGDSVNLGYTFAPVYVMGNISEVTIYGTEFDLNYSLSPALKLFGNYSYNIGKISRIGSDALSYSDLTGKFLTDIPAHKFAFGISTENKWLNVSLTGKYTGARWIKDDNTVDAIYLLSDRYAPYFLAGMKVWRRFNAIEIACEADNLTNVIYINSRGYKSHGRFFLFRLSYQFKKKK